MITSDQWADLFQIAWDRKPTPQEFVDAKKLSFAITSLGDVPAEKIQQVWVAAFEKLNERKPLPEEFQKGKSEKFTLDSLLQDDLAQSLEPFAEETPVATEQLQPKAPKERKPLSQKEKQRIGLIVGAIAAVWLLISLVYFFTGYFGVSPTGFNFYGTRQSSTLTRYVAAYNKNHGLGNDVEEWYVWSDTKKPIKVSELTVKPTLPQKISVRSILPGTSMRKIGRKFLLFPDYKVVVVPQQLAVRINSEGLNLYVDKTKIGSSTKTSSNTASISRLFPGDYSVSAVGIVNKTQVDISKGVTVTSGRNETSFTLKFITFHLYSNLRDGNVFVGISKIGSLTGADYKFTNIPVLEGEELQVRKKFSDGIVKTDTIPIDTITDGSSIYLNWAQRLNMTGATSLFESALNEFSSLANGYGSGGNLGQVFTGGAENSLYRRFSSDIEHKTSPLRAYSPTSISLSGLSINKITQTGVNSYTVKWSLEWDFWFSSVANSDNTKSASGDYCQTFSYTTKVKYVPSQNAAQESAQEDSTDYQSDTTNGPGSDSANFRIGKLLKHKLVSSNNQVDIYSSVSWW